MNMSILHNAQNRQPASIVEGQQDVARRMSSKGSIYDDEEEEPKQLIQPPAVDEDHVDHDSSEEEKHDMMAPPIPPQAEQQAAEASSKFEERLAPMQGVPTMIPDGVQNVPIACGASTDLPPAGVYVIYNDVPHQFDDRQGPAPLPQLPFVMQQPIIQPTDFTEKVFCDYYVPNMHVGRVIGRHGQTITDIQNRSKAQIEVPQESPAGSDFRQIKIYGTREQIEFCLVLIKLQLPLQSDFEIANLHQDVVRLQAKNDENLTIINIEVPMVYVGRIIGRKGHYLRQLKEATGATVILPRFSMLVSQQQIFTITGRVDQVAKCEELLRIKIRDAAKTSIPGHPGYFMNPGELLPAQQHRQQRQQHSASMQETTLVHVPTQHVGRVIGKGGSHIRDLQRQSGAKIYLPEDSGLNMPSRRMRIHGTPEQRMKCYKLLVNKVPDLECLLPQTAATTTPYQLSQNGYLPPPPQQHNYCDAAAGNNMMQMFSRMDLEDDSLVPPLGSNHQHPLMMVPMGFLQHPGAHMPPRMHPTHEQLGTIGSPPQAYASSQHPTVLPVSSMLAMQPSVAQYSPPMGGTIAAAEDTDAVRVFHPHPCTQPQPLFPLVESASPRRILKTSPTPDPIVSCMSDAYPVQPWAADIDAVVAQNEDVEVENVPVP